MTYRFSWSYSFKTNPDRPVAQECVYQATVEGGGVDLVQSAVDIPWTDWSVEFVAFDSSYEIGFNSGCPDNGGAPIVVMIDQDQVSVRPV